MKDETVAGEGAELGSVPASEELVDAVLPHQARAILFRRLARHAGLFPNHTPKQLADRYGVSVETVRRWRAEPSFRRIASETAAAADADVLQSSIDWLRGHTLEHTMRLHELAMQDEDRRAAIAALGKLMELHGMAKVAPPAVPQAIILLQASLGNLLVSGQAAVIEGTIAPAPSIDATVSADREDRATRPAGS